MTRNYRPAAMRASDADRDAVVSDLSEHFQAGRLTALIWLLLPALLFARRVICH